jgi:hypothetical protein
MAYAITTISKDDKTQHTLEAPVGFSFETLFPPLIASVFSMTIVSIIMKLAFSAGMSDFTNVASSLGGKAALVLFSLIFLFNLVAVAYAPLSRNDKKWAKRMVVIAILTGGISILFFAFFYNKLYLKDKFKEGYKIVEIRDSIPSRAKSLAESNPIESAVSSTKSQIWVQRFGISWIKEFDTIEKATDYISKYPHRCLKISAISKVSNENGNLIAKPELFVLPINNWAKEASAQH